MFVPNGSDPRAERSISLTQSIRIHMSIRLRSHRAVGSRQPVRGCWIGALCALLAPVVASCAGGGEELAPTPIAACVARDGELRADATLVRGAGRYHLTLVTAGDGAGRTVTGTLELNDNEPSLRRLPTAGGVRDETVLLPLHGWAAIDLAAVDALEIGDIGSRDPLQPGVLVLEQRAAGPGAGCHYAAFRVHRQPPRRERGRRRRLHGTPRRQHHSAGRLRRHLGERRPRPPRRRPLLRHPPAGNHASRSLNPLAPGVSGTSRAIGSIYPQQFSVSESGIDAG